MVLEEHVHFFSLDGDWTLTPATTSHSLPARLAEHDRGEEIRLKAVVPGCVHTDLLREGVIDDPYYRDNELSQMWVGETDWVFSRSFRVPAELLQCEYVELVFEGLDTLAEVVLNGRLLGRTDNAFRTWRFDVSDALANGENSIEVRFDAPVPAAARANEQDFYWHTGLGAERLAGINHLRKNQSNFGWDWGPRCATSGIWRPVRLEGVRGGRFAGMRVVQESLSDAAAQLCVQVTCEGVTGAATVRARALLDSHDVAVGTAHVDEHQQSEMSLHIAEPKWWWPNGSGEQVLYTIVCELLDEHGEVLDSRTRRVGLRSIRLVREEDTEGESFRFEVNGRPLYMKGANWIPADTFVTRVSAAHYRRLLEGAVSANMNMLRVWGGGIYEDEVFYDLCDELGLLVWQDFMFACAAYPADKPEFMANVREEAREQIIRLRDHACMALWCGNNEMEQIHPCIGDGEEARAAGAMTWESYEALFDRVLAELVEELHSEGAYWPSSPHTPGAKRGDANEPGSGDAHLWMVWHGRRPFEAYRECEHRFISEFGFQSFPEPQAVARYTAPGDRNVTSRIMEHHQRSPIGNDAIIQYMLEWFRLPSRPDMVLWVSQILQGLAVTYGVEYWRRNAPRTMGTLYWQLNDCWPVASWSSIDWEGRWKALHYMMARAYAPLLLSAVEDAEAGTIRLYVTSDEAQPCETLLTWRMWTVDGEVIALGEEDVDVPASGTVEVVTLEFDEQIGQLGAHTLVFFGELYRGDTRESDVMVTFVRPKHLDLRDPRLSVDRHPGEDGREQWVISAEKPALWVWPDLPGVDMRYSDRF
ncbi:MAG: beta-mannosidase, partial [bacterium]